MCSDVTDGSSGTGGHWTQTLGEIAQVKQVKQNSRAPTNSEQNPHINLPHQQPSDVQEFKNTTRSLFDQMGTGLNLLTTLFTKMK
jgi:hypothetical protein